MSQTAMQRTIYTHRLAEWPSGLKTADEVAAAFGISPSRIIELAEAGYVPHYRADDGPCWFKPSEVKKWVAENLSRRCEGRCLPEPVHIALDVEKIASFATVPQSIRTIAGLRQLPRALVGSGIYFLCQGDEVSYVGQSKNILMRVSAHAANGVTFDTFYFLPWPPDDLDRVEGALIRYLRPPLNGQTKGRLHAPREPSCGDAAILAEIVQEKAP